MKNARSFAVFVFAFLVAVLVVESVDYQSYQSPTSILRLEKPNIPEAARGIVAGFDRAIDGKTKGRWGLEGKKLQEGPTRGLSTL